MLVQQGAAARCRCNRVAPAVHGCCALAHAAHAAAHAAVCWLTALPHRPSVLAFSSEVWKRPLPNCREGGRKGRQRSAHGPCPASPQVLARRAPWQDTGMRAWRRRPAEQHGKGGTTWRYDMAVPHLGGGVDELELDLLQGGGTERAGRQAQQAQRWLAGRQQAVPSPLHRQAGR